ncbi:CCA tRNA nucleotidyltransferase [Clostridium polynesiense]|uniref:CCA tRNA nucleotidyltransferase n=1 Tax=Clostridium polynesiense TaxID=1325933 RepID=UPI00058E48AA|nr:CCA tRNA nucleotidyltransferase [Clostridium polynesiense]
MIINLPHKVDFIINELYRNGFEAFAVGGCVRDSLLSRTPGDWDIATNALPDDIIDVFNKTIPTGMKHGTITVLIEKEPFEVTTYRVDGEYKDNRRPEKVEFVSSIQEDLSRRDFTINAMAYNYREGLIDHFNGQQDLNNKIIRSVGNADLRFKEDALRMLRCIRFSAQLQFSIEEDTFNSMIKNSSLIKNISHERIRTELNKILLCEKPSSAFIQLEKSSLLKYILPEVQKMVGFDQKNPHHDKDIFIHTLTVMDNTPKDLYLRLAGLFHDIAKPVTFSMDKKGIGHFYGHDKVGTELTEKILRRLTYDNKTVDIVKKLVREHMIMFDRPKDKTIKKLINRIGSKNMPLLFQLQRADLRSSAPPFDYSNIEYMEKKSELILENKEPLSIKDLNITGENLMKELNLQQGKTIGDILNYLLDRVLENPELNDYNKLLNLAKKFFNSL